MYIVCYIYMFTCTCKWMYNVHVAMDVHTTNLYMYLRLCKFLCHFTLFEAIQHVELASQCYCLTDSVCLLAAVASSWTHIVTLHEPFFFCWVYPLHTNTIYNTIVSAIDKGQLLKYTTYSSCTFFEYTFVPLEIQDSC